MKWQLVWRGEDWSLEKTTSVWPPLGAQVVNWCFFTGPPGLQISANPSNRRKRRDEWKADEEQVDQARLDRCGPALLELHLFLWFLRPCLVCVGDGCSGLLPANKTNPSEMVWDIEWNNWFQQWTRCAKVSRIHRPSLQLTHENSIWLQWIKVMMRVNYIWLLSLRMMLLLMFEVMVG